MNSSKKSLLPIAYIAGSFALLGLGYLTYTKLLNNTSVASSDSASLSTESKDGMPKTLAKGSVVKIGGATSLTQVNQSLKAGFEKKFSGAQALITTSSSDQGIKDLLAGSIDISGISRELTAEEKAQGLVAVTVTPDKIAVVVSAENDFNKGLTFEQVSSIFTGKVKNWSEVGGKSLAIRPILRPEKSGTHQSFQKIALKGQSFGSGETFKVLEDDSTTSLLQSLGADGIGYSTYTQVVGQSKVRALKIDGVIPEFPNYPYRRDLSYVYKKSSNEATKAFVTFANTSEGQNLIHQ